MFGKSVLKEVYSKSRNRCLFGDSYLSKNTWEHKSGKESIGNTGDIGMAIGEDRHTDGQMSWDLLWDLPHVIMVTKKPLCLPSAAGELGDCEYNSWSSNHIQTGKGRLWGIRGIPSLSPKVHPQTKSITPNQEHQHLGRRRQMFWLRKSKEMHLTGPCFKVVINKIPFLLVWASIFSISKSSFMTILINLITLSDCQFLVIIASERKLGNNLFAGKPRSQLALLTCYHKY